jgi:hypothetical protein
MKSSNERLFGYSIASIHRLYVQKVEHKGRAREDVDTVLCWLTGHTPESLQSAMDNGETLKSFFAQAPALNPARALITGTICGVRVEEIEDKLTQNIRYMDKLVDEVAKGRPMEKILRH